MLFRIAKYMRILLTLVYLQTLLFVSFFHTHEVDVCSAEEHPGCSESVQLYSDEECFACVLQSKLQLFRNYKSLKLFSDKTQTNGCLIESHTPEQVFHFSVLPRAPPLHS